MRSISLNHSWYFGYGQLDPGSRAQRRFGSKVVNLPHDYMIENAVSPEAPAAAASGYYNAGVAHYVKETEIPSEWADGRVFLRLDGAMMNATVEVNGAKAGLQHYGYAPFEMDITQYVYPGETNRIVITLNPSMQPNSRWYSGAGLFRGVELVHTPGLYLPMGALSAYTRKIDYDSGKKAEAAYLQLQAEVRNSYAENRLAEVTFELLDEADGSVLLSRKTLTQVQPMSAGHAYATMTVDSPRLWSADDPQLYRLQVRVRDAGTFRTHQVRTQSGSEDTDSVLFGIRTVEADVRHGLQINGQTVKLKGGCLHHDNGILGAVSTYEIEARKVRILKEIGFNAVRTTHNPPSAALIEACDRLGMYVFDEAFDAWGMGKQPGDYNQFFDTDWERDLSAFVRRDRCHPSVILWSTGNEITERGGLNDGYIWAVRLAETVRALDPSRPVSNGICSFWNGLDDALQEANMRAIEDSNASLQNANPLGPDAMQWEHYTEAFANGLDIVGYNYLEDLYERDHALYPDRVILGSENFPVRIGEHWPMIEKTPWVIGDFTWTAWDYIGEAGIGKAMFFDPDDPEAASESLGWQYGSPYPWRLANDADVDITGRILPQGVYRRIVWGSPETAVFSYDPAHAGKTEVMSRWGFPSVSDCWNWTAEPDSPVDLVVFSRAEEVELKINGMSAGRLRAGEALVHGMPCTFLFHAAYIPGCVEAVSYKDGHEVSRACLKTTGAVQSIRLTAERSSMPADGASLAYIHAELVDADGHVVPDSALQLKAEITGPAELLGFGSANPITDQAYTSGTAPAYRGRALAVLRAGTEAGTVCLKVAAEGVEAVCLTLPVEKV